ncbi:MAG: hypothetical protein ACHQX4_09075, partial [Gemmatimonadales bacterium]
MSVLAVLLGLALAVIGATTGVAVIAARRLELTRWVADRDVPVTLMASVIVLNRTTARILAGGEVPGVVIPQGLIDTVEREAASPDKGKA